MEKIDKAVEIIKKVFEEDKEMNGLWGDYYKTRLEATGLGNLIKGNPEQEHQLEATLRYEFINSICVKLMNTEMYW